MKTTYRIILILFILGGIQSKVQSQHCVWDGTTLLIVEVKSQETNLPIKGLKITLISQDSVCMPTNYQDTCRLFLENKPNNFMTNWETYQQVKQGNATFSHAGSNYTLTTYNPSYLEQTSFFLKIEDIDQSANQGRFETQYVAISDESFVQLCTGADKNAWNDPHFVQKAIIKVQLNALN